VKLKGTGIDNGNISAATAQYGLISTLGINSRDPYVNDPYVDHGVVDQVAPGEYIITVVAICSKGGAPITKTYAVPITVLGTYSGSPNLAITLGAQPYSCDATGSVIAGISGELPPYTIRVMKDGLPFDTYDVGNNLNPTLTGLPAGNYTFTVTDDCGYSSPPKPYTLIAKPDITLTPNGAVTPTFECSNEGKIPFTIAGGKPSYTIYLDDNVYATVTSPGNYTVENLAAGSHTVKIIDACPIEKSITQTVGIVSLDFIKEIKHTSPCLPNGKITVEITKGKPPFKINVTSDNASYITLDDDISSIGTTYSIDILLP
jgi:hypothetical protein